MRGIWIRAALAAIIAIFFACTNGSETREPPISIGETTDTASDASTYWNNEPPLSMEDIELGRHDSTWLEIASADTSRVELALLDTVDVEPLEPPPGLPTVQLPVSGDAEGPSVLYVQVLLDRSPFSPGILDGKWGKNTRKAVYWLQRSAGMDPTGEVDSLTFLKLVELAGRPDRYVDTVRLTQSDVAGPFVEIPADVHAQAELECMCFRSALEKVAERYHATPELLAQLNPTSALDSLAAGDSLHVPNVVAKEPEPRATTALADSASGMAGEVSRIVISIDGFYLHALDEDGRLLYHFPVTVGSKYQPSPTGDFQIASVTFDPWFHWQPVLFDEVPDTEKDERIRPGPNSPVGVVWMALSKENYGIHGTSEPSTIGYVTSHGCVRLTNWDARFLAERVSAGIPVDFRDLPAGVDGPVATAGR